MSKKVIIIGSGDSIGKKAAIKSLIFEPKVIYTPNKHEKLKNGDKK